MPQTKPHGHKRKHLFKVGDLVRWNHWRLSEEYHEYLNGVRKYDRRVTSDLGIVLRVYQSTSKARCWTADVRFVDIKFDDYWGLGGCPIPLNCLDVTK